MSLDVISHITNKRILFSPLNWGFGHVSRSIPILEKLLTQSNQIVVACDKEQEKIYREYFPDLVYLYCAGYPFQFSGKGNFAWDLLKSLPKMIVFRTSELKFVEEACARLKIDIVLSDHRYFFRSKNVPSYFVTHQVSLPLKWYLKIAQLIHKNWVNLFDEIWILDNERHSFAGKLSQGQSKPKQFFLGPVSRFMYDNSNDKAGTLIVVSGPEPYASQFYKLKKEQLVKTDKIVYRGKIESLISSEEITWKKLDREMLKAEKIISRAGYSTIMDIHFLNCKSELHPTEGQWEQEYLSDYMNESIHNRGI